MKNYFKKLENVSTIRFIVTLSLIAFFSKIPMGILGTVLIDLFDVTNPLFTSALQEPTFSGDDMFLAIVFAPLFETLLAQTIPIEFLKKLTTHSKTLIFASATVFMVFHFPAIEFFPSAFVVGLVFAWAWIVKRPLGFWKAFAIVTLIHSMHNAMVAAFAAILL